MLLMGTIVVKSSGMTVMGAVHIIFLFLAHMLIVFKGKILVLPFPALP